MLSGKVLELANWKVNPNNIILVAEFTEAGTGIMETAISRTEVMHEALKLEFANYMPKYFNLGLPYYGKVNLSLTSVPFTIPLRSVLCDTY